MPKISPPSPPKFNEWLSGEAVVRHCLMIFKDKLSQEEIMSMSSIQEEREWPFVLSLRMSHNTATI